MKKQSWVCTIFTQVSLCFALYIVLNLGEIQNHDYVNGSGSGSGGNHMDMYFISVTGGFRPLDEQTLLLKLIEKVAKKYNAKFVINISEFGDDDPLVQNATLHFPSLKLPWYSTRALQGRGAYQYLKQIKFTHGSIDIIALDTGLYHVSGAVDSQLQWLTETLKNRESDWCIVAGFHPLVACEKDTAQMETENKFKSFHHIFLKYGVDAYLSAQACADGYLKESVANFNTGKAIYEGPLLTKLNQELLYAMEIPSGFLLHRVSALEIVSHVVSLEGDVVEKISLQQRGKEIM